MDTPLATVVFLMRGTTVCLAPKKQHIHTKEGVLDKSAETLNGYGGKAEENEDVLTCAIRELQSESGVLALAEDLEPVADINFFWPKNTSVLPNIRVFFFFLKTWKGEPKEGDEMGVPHFYELNAIPYQRMLKGDRLFLPFIFEGETLVGSIRLHEPEVIDLRHSPVTLP